MLLHHSIRRSSLAVMAAIVGLTGCTDLQVVKKLNPFGHEKLREATAQAPAVEVLALWQPAEGRGLNGMPTRGFAGQIMFFTNGDPSPVKVHGDVRLFMFDDFGTTEEQSKPIHQFDYDTNIWNMHLQKSMLGASYQVFVPYVRKDHHAAKCAISLRLKPADGPTIYSKLVSITLPGLEKEKPAPGGALMTKGGAARPESGAQKATGESPVELAAKLQASSKSTKLGSALTTQSAANEELDTLIQQLVVKSNKLDRATRARTPKTTQIQTMTDDTTPSHPIALNPANSTDAPDRKKLPRKVIVESAEDFQNASAEAVEPILVELPHAAEAEPIRAK